MFVYSKKGLINYLNSRSTTEFNLTEARSNDEVTELTVFSHGLPNTLEFNYGRGGVAEELGTFTRGDVQLLEPDAFESPRIDLYSCGAAYFSHDPGEELSEEETRRRLDETLVGVLAEHTGGIVSGFVGESSYRFKYLHPGEGWFRRKWDQIPNGFDIEGSNGYPGPGDGTGALGTYIPGSGQVVIDRRRP